MILILQLGVFALIFWYRRRFLLGGHLKATKSSALPYYYEQKNKSRVVAQHIGIESKQGFPFTIRYERFYHRLLKALGLASEIQLADSKLDDMLYFSTDFPQPLTHMLQSTKMREAVSKLFSTKVNAIYATSGRIWAVINSKSITRDISSFKDEIALLQQIAEELANASQQPYMMTRQHKWIAMLFLTAHFSLLALAALGWVPAMIDSSAFVSFGEWFDGAMYYSVPVVLLWLALIIILLRGTSWIALVLADFLLYGWIGVLICSTLFVREINIDFDRSEPVMHEMSVMSKSCTLICKKGSGKHSTTHSYALNSAQCDAKGRGAVAAKYVAMDPVCAASTDFRYVIHTTHWHEDKEYYRIEPDSGMYDRVDIRSTIEIPTHPGMLGLEWVDLKQIKPRE